jgi:AraC family transcriptional activator of pyochelin receptor
MNAECVVVSEEMLALVGGAETGVRPLPADAIALCFDFRTVPTLRLRESVAEARGDVVLLVSRATCERLFARDVIDEDYHLPPELRMIVVAIRDCALGDAARTVYRLGKAIELLCESFRAIEAMHLVPIRDDGILSLGDARRLFEARRLIDERWHEKLTIDNIARACGLNRVKLTQGFRRIFHTTVANAIAERRLDAASLLLRTTDRPVSTIGYESGYLNNASFARAFARRFGLCPSDYRAAKLAA